MAKKNPFLVPTRRKKPKKAHPKPSTETPPSGPSVSDINSQVIAEAKANALAQPVTMKLCRLCETKDGPFLNIFEAEQVIAKKIDTLLPFTVRLLLSSCPYRLFTVILTRSQAQAHVLGSFLRVSILRYLSKYLFN